MTATTRIKPLPPEVRKRIGQMIPLLSSANAGECAAAAAAIGRLLKAHDLDWHDLTAVVADTPPSAPPPPRREPPSPDSRNLSAEAVRTLVYDIFLHHRHLNDRARAFLHGQLARAKYGRVLLTERQWKWLMDLREEARSNDDDR